MPEWKYLWSEAFKSRYVLAAWLLRDCKHIVEIGGYRTPITDFLDLEKGFHDSVTVFDPKMRPENRMHLGKFGNVRIDHNARPWDGVPLKNIPKPFGLAMLGLELHLAEENWRWLFRYVQAAQRTVIEYAVSFPTGIQQYARILKETGAKVVFQAGLDLSGNDFGDLTDSAPLMAERRIVALETR